MRFGIKTAPQHTTWAAMLDVWRAADDIELFDSAWNFDHFYPIFSDSDGPCLEAWTMLGAMASATRLGFAICMAWFTPGNTIRSAFGNNDAKWSLAAVRRGPLSAP